MTFYYLCLYLLVFCEIQFSESLTASVGLNVSEKVEMMKHQASNLTFRKYQLNTMKQLFTLKLNDEHAVVKGGGVTKGCYCIITSCSCAFLPCFQ